MKTIANMLRKKELLSFGFGTDAMKNVTVCTNCNSMESADESFCSKCGSSLPRVNLYDYYRAQHKSCPNCKVVLSKSMDFLSEMRN